MKKLVLIGLAMAAAYFGGIERFIPARDDVVTTIGGDDAALAAAFENRRSDVQIEGSGRVTRVLPDDSDGSRHQRFILELASGQTLLVAHNIDLANRVASIRAGDRIAFKGEYEWNARGGMVHWTHRDPQRSHVDGWIKHNGHTYQ